MIFQVNQFESCPVTSFTDIDISWNVGKGDKNERRSFSSPGNAKGYIISCARDALLIRTEKYVKALKNLSGYDTGYYHTIRKDQQLKELWSLLVEINKMMLVDVANQVYDARDKFYGILPGEKHPYYKALREDIIEIVAFAKGNRDFNYEANLKLAA